MTKISNCGLRHPMKLVPFAIHVRMDVKAFPIHPSGPLLITKIAADATLKLFFMVLMFFLVTQVRNCEDEPHLE
ncbi:hypothetical protein T07_6397 [Trichinella nelsoni]|uniref:Uncharacterized protein n=1 Tax=Trichinella nelsoni TaxID=6336 RepID=A0A0V0RE98_9BILA|nr:hypothetical protein T07_6397 [Trichinella nelsoni]